MYYLTFNLNNKMIESQSFKLEKGDKFISLKLLNNIIKETDIQKAVVEEENSELWFETLNGFGTVFFTNNITYKGYIKYGLLESISEEQLSTITFPDGTKYVGTVRNNQITGKGTYYFPEGSEYTGDILNGLRHGYGKYDSNTGVVYEGEWFHGLKHGKGKIIQGNMILEGEWVNGVIEGKGRIKWKNGNAYDGDIHENKMNGNGYMIWYNYNEKYVGQWTENSQNGFGIFIWYEHKGDLKLLRNRYVGEWVNGIRNGFGFFYYSNGSYYEGYWKNDMREGFGIFTDTDRRQTIGYYKEDKRIEDNLFTRQNKKKNPSIIPNVASNTNRLLKTFLRKNSLNQTTNTIANLLNLTNVSKGLETIKEAEEKTIVQRKSTNNNNQNESVIAEEQFPPKTGTNSNLASSITSLGIQNKIIQTLNEIKIYINISDIITIDNSIKDSLKEIDNILLRNLTFFSKIYSHALGRESNHDYDLGASTISRSQVNETRSQFGNPLPNKLEIPEEKKESIIVYDCIYNDDLYFCLDMQLIWKFLREIGLITSELSIAMFDRLFFLTSKNYIEMFYLPKGVSEDKTYDSLYQMIQKRKQIFNTVNKSLIERSYLLLNQDPNYEDNMIISQKEGNQNRKIKCGPSPDIHDHRHIILLRHFYEVFIRLAYLKLYLSSSSLDQKLKQLIEIIKMHFKTKRKTIDSSMSISVASDMKMKNWDTALEAFKSGYENQLRKLYLEIYLLATSKPKYHDMTIKYAFMYSLLSKKNQLKEIAKDKYSFTEIISLHHKDKVVLNQNSIKLMNSYDTFKYVHNLFETEMIYYEFSEVVFFIAKKYIVTYNKEEDDYELVFKLFFRCCEEIKEEEKKFKPNYYCYPKLKSHKQIEKLKKEEKEKIIEEQKIKSEVIRCSKERKMMMEEDVNHYDKKEEMDSYSSEYL